MFRFVLALFSIFVISGYAYSAYAQEEDLNKKREEAKEKIERKIAEINKNNDGDERTHFTGIYSNYNIIAVTKAVRNNVESAIQSCGENNPDEKSRYDERFKAWIGEVNPILEESRAHLDNMVLAQDYADKDELEELFTLIDEGRALTDEQFKKIPVSSPEACEFLINKMDNTQAQFVTLLRGTLLSLPQSLPEEEASEAEGGADNAESEEEEAETAEDSERYSPPEE